jgi:hypothetical protein
MSKLAMDNSDQIFVGKQQKEVFFVYFRMIVENHQCSLTEYFKFQGQEIPNLPLDQSLKYLRKAIATRRNIKLKDTYTKFDKMKTLV